MKTCVERSPLAGAFLESRVARSDGVIIRCLYNSYSSLDQCHKICKFIIVIKIPKVFIMEAKKLLSSHKD